MYFLKLPEQHHPLGTKVCQRLRLWGIFLIQTIAGSHVCVGAAGGCHSTEVKRKFA